MTRPTRPRCAPLALLAGLAILLAAALPPAPAAAQTATGTIKGRVHDRESGEALPYTNIYIAGTNIGTMAFTDGYFILRGLAPGGHEQGEETL